MTGIIFHQCKKCGKSFPDTGTKHTVHCMFCGEPHHFFSGPAFKKDQENPSEASARFAPPVKSYLFLCPQCRMYKSASYKTVCDGCKKGISQSSERNSAGPALHISDGKTPPASSYKHEGKTPEYAQAANRESSGAGKQAKYFCAVVLLSILLWTTRGQPLIGFGLGLSSLMYGWIAAIVFVLLTNTRKLFSPIALGLSFLFSVYFFGFDVDGRIFSMPSREEELWDHYQEQIDEYCDISDC